jgi:hypothetical protein
LQHEASAQQPEVSDPGGVRRRAPLRLGAMGAAA